MLHHLSLAVADLDRAACFYDAALAPLGYVRVWTAADAVGYGPPGGDDQLAIKHRPGATAPGPGFHVALAAPSRYGASYYAAFAIDPDGHRLEAVIDTEPVSSSPGAA